MGWLMDLRKDIGHRTLVVPHSCIFVINNNREILLQLREDDGLYDVHGGSVEIDEEVEECAKRELFEETGLICNNLFLFKVYSGKKEHHTYPNGDDVSPVDVCFITTDFQGDLTPDACEVKQLKFFKESELDSIVIKDNVRERIQEAFKSYDKILHETRHI